MAWSPVYYDTCHMLIGIEASRANCLQKTGVEWYAYHVIQQLKRLPEAVAHSWLLYSNEPLCLGLEQTPPGWHERRLRWPPRYLWTQLRLSWEMRWRPPELLFVPAHVLPRWLPRKSVVTVHDVGFKRFPELYKPIQVAYHDISTKDIVKRASHILTVSEFSKQELIELYGARPEQVSVTLLGVDHERYAPQPLERVRSFVECLHIASPYVLFIGRLERKKNVVALVEALHQWQSEEKATPIQLVLAGIPGVGFSVVQEAIRRLPYPERVHITGYVNEEEKILLLSGATALIHPSLYEGFGITPLEAMACGCPVISSFAGSLPEVLGKEHALWFDPRQPAMIVESLRAFLSESKEQREERSERARIWVARYRWEETARQTLEALTRCA